MTTQALVTEFRADTTGLEAGCGRAAQVLNRLGGVFGGVFAALSAQSLLRFGREALDYASSLQKLAEGAGLATSDLYRLGRVAKESGGGVETVANAVLKLSANLREAGGAGPAARDALRSLGLELREIDQLSSGDKMKKILTSLAGVRDLGTRSLLAKNLFGEEAAKNLAPNLNPQSLERILALPVPVDDVKLKAMRRAVEDLDEIFNIIKLRVADRAVGAAGALGIVQTEDDGHTSINTAKAEQFANLATDVGVAVGALTLLSGGLKIFTGKGGMAWAKAGTDAVGGAVGGAASSAFRGYAASHAPQWSAAPAGSFLDQAVGSTGIGSTAAGVGNSGVGLSDVSQIALDLAGAKIGTAAAAQMVAKATLFGTVAVASFMAGMKLANWLGIDNPDAYDGDNLLVRAFGGDSKTEEDAAKGIAKGLNRRDKFDAMHTEADYNREKKLGILRGNEGYDQWRSQKKEAAELNWFLADLRDKREAQNKIDAEKRAAAAKAEPAVKKNPEAELLQIEDPGRQTCGCANPSC
ncbi:hypothetical protein CCP3SC15_710009 [Gammaproteobacteria bacterium]